MLAIQFQYLDTGMCTRLGHHKIICTVDMTSFRFRLTLKVSLNNTAVKLTVRESCPN